MERTAASVDGVLLRGRELYAERAWAACREVLREVDARTPLAPADLILLSISSYLCGLDGDSVQALTRCYQGSLAAEDWHTAAMSSFWLCFMLMNLGDVVHASAWSGRSRDVIAEHAVAGAPAAYHECMRAHQLVDRGAPEEALEIALAGIAIGRAEAEPDLEVLNRLTAGHALIGLGRPAEALDQMDRVILAVEGDPLSPPVAGLAYCAAIAACLHLFDLRRARDWTVALTSWCDAQSGEVPYRGLCLVHRAHVMTMQGSWSDALAEAGAARDRMDGPSQGEAHYQLGELHRLLGQAGEAETAYRLANGRGRQPEPGLSLLRLAQGRVDAAARTIQAVYAEQGRTDRAEILAAYAEIMTRAGRLDEARAAATELVSLSDRVDVPLLRARAEQASAAVLLAGSDAPAALPLLRRAWRRWQEMGMPHDAARVRVLIGTALQMIGDSDSAWMEFDAARTVFEQLGAGFDLAALEEASPSPSGLLTAREVEVLRLVAVGHTNRAIAGRLFLSEKTVARHLSNIYAKLDVSSRTAATAYAYDHGLV